ncbi:hypothetical protein ACFQH5_01815 [Halomonas salifodinae]|uniref:Uncharacterized protein n=1 Tax=Halomonas salifodinae TaxID=438745 RepID=A0ABW2EW76_9GAMM
MKIGSQVSAYVQSSKQINNAKESGGVVSGSKSADEAKASPPAGSTSVTISGRALMLSRLFLTEDATSEPPVLPGSQGMGQYGAMLPHHFLTRDDRSLLAEMYEFADEQGADLKHVDRLAWDLGLYRQRNDGKAIANFNDGRSYDLEGRVRTVSFTDKDTATAERILQSDALNSTQLDQGFLSYILDPGYGFTHGSDFEFLEQMVTRFSSRGSEAATLDPKFSTYVRIENNYILHTADEITLQPFEPDITNVNGVWSVTEKGAAAGITLDQVIGNTQRSLATSAGQEQNQYILDAFFGKSDEKAPERGLLSRLIELMKTSNTKRG